MNISIRTLTCAAAVAAFVPAFAQDEETDDLALDPADEALVEKGEKHISEIDQRVFTVLPSCKRVEGRAEACAPDAETWVPVEEGRFYPLGSKFRTVTPESKLEVSFGKEVFVTVFGQSSFATRRQGLDVKSRTIVLDSGKIELKLPLGFPEKMFTVAAPGFTVENPAGVSRYAYSRKSGDGDTASVRCISGMLSVKGRHFTVPEMHSANEIEIRTSQDALFTGLFGKSGDFVCHLDNGLMQEIDWENQKTTIVEKSYDWHLTPQTAVRIHRKQPELGTNLAVSILTFDSNGALKNRWTFTENRHEINTGDQGPATLAERARAQRALEEAAAKAVETPAEAPSEVSAEE